MPKDKLKINPCHCGAKLQLVYELPFERNPCLVCYNVNCGLRITTIYNQDIILVEQWNTTPDLREESPDAER